MKHADRVGLYKEIEKARGSRLVAFVNGERLGLQTQIADDAVPPFVSVLDEIGPSAKITLLLTTNGGQTSAGWTLINLLRSFCDELEVLVPWKAMSAGTLMALGADKIVMTKQASLGPIDPSLANHPLAPMVQGPAGQPFHLPVSAEAIRGYLNEVKKDIRDPSALAQIWTSLSSQIHPLVLGDIFRLGDQIRNLAKALIERQVPDTRKQKEIIQLLCSDSGSHDYTINRRQAASIGLSIEKPSAELYRVLSEVTKSYNEELRTLEPFSPQSLLGGQQRNRYTLVRGLIESTDASYGFVSEGEAAIDPAGNVSDSKSFEGWRKLP